MSPTETKYLRHIYAYKDYFKEFKKGLQRSTLTKIYQVFLCIMTLNHIPSVYLKKIEDADGLYEIRVEEQGNIYRIFCCFDEGNLVVLFNAFQKKTQKTPKSEIRRAQGIMNDYFNDKKRKEQ